MEYKKFTGFAEEETIVSMIKVGESIVVATTRNIYSLEKDFLIIPDQPEDERDAIKNFIVAKRLDIMVEDKD